MVFTCPKCGKPVTLNMTACSCEFPLTFWSLFWHYVGRACNYTKQHAAVACPHCKQAVPMMASTCPNCKKDITVSVAVDTTLGPVRQGYQSFLENATPATARVIQWIYLVVSAILLWWIFPYVEENLSLKMAAEAGVTLFFLVAITLILRLIGLSFVFTTISRRATWMVKLALLCNFLTVLVLLRILIAAWWIRALSLAGFLFVGLVVIWLLRALLMPRQVSVNRSFDPSTPQGRSGYYD